MGTNLLNCGADHDGTCAYRGTVCVGWGSCDKKECHGGTSYKKRSPMNQPLQLLSRWLGEAGDAEVPAPLAMTLTTVGADARPSARVVSLKRLEDRALIFTTGLWTRKVEELRQNPGVAGVFYWPALGRQVRIEGTAELAERELAEELFAARPLSHQLQTLVSRQGEAIEDIASLRTRLEALSSDVKDKPIRCPDDWGAVRLTPEVIEFWTEGSNRLHDRLSYRAGADGWQCSRLAP
jgi:pyridoxamine 5'-phosphate oxidase